MSPVSWQKQPSQQNAIYHSYKLTTNSVKTNSAHVLQPYLPDQTNIPYRLRTRPHNMTMINKTKVLNDTDFIIRMLYKYSY